ncbi:hypothetical protein [Photobacterium sp. R1]
MASGLPFFASFLFAFIPMYTVYWFGRYDEDIIKIVFAIFFFLPLPILIFVLGAERFPTRYYQKISASGFYSHGVKVGSERRQKMGKFCMVGGFAIAIILLFVAGQWYLLGLE